MTKHVLLSLAALGLATSLQAQTIVDWSADTTNQSLRSPTNDGALWDASAALISGTGSETVYGGFFGDNSTGNTSDWKSGNTGGVETWRFGTTFDSGSDRDFGVLFNTSGTPTLNAGDTFSAVFTSNNGSSVGQIRWLVSNDSNFYVSEVIGTNPGRTNSGPVSDVTTSSTLSGLDWFLVDFSSPGGGVVTIPGTTNAAATVFDAVDGVGVFGDEVNSGVRFAQFSVTPIPEPSAFTLLAGALALALVTRRRRA